MDKVTFETVEAAQKRHDDESYDMARDIVEKYFEKIAETGFITNVGVYMDDFKEDICFENEVLQVMEDRKIAFAEDAKINIGQLVAIKDSFDFLDDLEKIIEKRLFEQFFNQFDVEGWLKELIQAEFYQEPEQKEREREFNSVR